MGGMMEQLRALGINVPDEETGGGLSSMAPASEDPMAVFQRTMSENAPLVAAAREAALKTPKDREKEVYKQKIQEMFGVKLGEKNPKWRSVLRGVGEGLDALGAGYHGTPTIREKARRQAETDYKLENEVLGKDSTATLARMGQAAQLAGKAEVEKAKLEQARTLAEAKAADAKSPLTPKGKMLLAQAEELHKRGNYNDAGVALRLAQAELANARTNDVGQTNLTRNAAAVEDNPGMLETIFKLSGAQEAGKTAGGGGRQRTTTSLRGQVVDDPVTQKKVIVQVPGQTTTSTGGSPEQAYDFMKSLSRLSGAGQPPAPAQTQAAPPGQPESPNIEETNPTFSAAPRVKSPGISSKQTQAATSVIEAKRVRDLDVRTPAWGKLYTPLKAAATEASGVNDAVLAAALDVDSAGESALGKYTGGTGILRNFLGRVSGTRPASIVNSDDVIQTAADKYRHDITGAGAGYQEIKYLTSRFPEIGKQAGLDHKYTALQKALTLHFVAQKSLWNFEHDGAPALNGNFFPADNVNRQIDSIMNSYKQMEKLVAAASTPNERRKVVERFRTDLQSRMNARALYDEEWAKVNPSAPTGRKIVYK